MKLSTPGMHSKQKNKIQKIDIPDPIWDLHDPISGLESQDLYQVYMWYKFLTKTHQKLMSRVYKWSYHPQECSSYNRKINEKISSHALFQIYMFQYMVWAPGPISGGHIKTGQKLVSRVYKWSYGPEESSTFNRKINEKISSRALFQIYMTQYWVWA